MGQGHEGSVVKLRNAQNYFQYHGRSNHANCIKLFIMITDLTIDKIKRIYYTKILKLTLTEKQSKPQRKENPYLRSIKKVGLSPKKGKGR